MQSPQDQRSAGPHVLMFTGCGVHHMTEQGRRRRSLLRFTSSLQRGRNSFARPSSPVPFGSVKDGELRCDCTLQRSPSDLESDFQCRPIHETPNQFKARLQKVEDQLNSDDFSAPDGRGLEGLAKELRPRCEELVKRGGERLPK